MVFLLDTRNTVERMRAGQSCALAVGSGSVLSHPESPHLSSYPLVRRFMETCAGRGNPARQHVEVNSLGLGAVSCFFFRRKRNRCAVGQLLLGASAVSTTYARKGREMFPEG